MTIITPLANIPGLILELENVINASPVLRFVTPFFLRIFSSVITRLDKALLFNNAVDIEKQYYNSKEHAFLRRSVLTRPGLNGKFGATFSQREDTRTSFNIQGNVVTNIDTYRIDSYFEIPLCFIFWVTSVMIAFNPRRDDLCDLVRPGQAIPSILTQFTQKVRKAETNKVSYLPQLFRNPFVRIWPDLKGSILDLNFLTSKTGFMTYLDLCNFVYGQEGNYVAFNVVTDSNKSSIFPRLNSGMQVTFLAINTVRLPLRLSLTGKAELLPVNSFPNNIKSVHFFDAFIIGLSHFKDAKMTNIFSLSQENFDVLVPLFNLSNVFRYIVCRVDGTIINSSDITDDFFDLKEKSRTRTKTEGRNFVPKGNFKPKGNKVEKDVSSFSTPFEASDFAIEFSTAYKQYLPIIRNIGRRMFTHLLKDVVNFKNSKSSYAV